MNNYKFASEQDPDAENRKSQPSLINGKNRENKDKNISVQLDGFCP